MSFQQPPVAGQPSEKTKQQLSDALGEDAPVYAQARADAARLRGADEDAERWNDVANDLATSDSAEA